MHICRNNDECFVTDRKEKKRFSQASVILSTMSLMATRSLLLFVTTRSIRILLECFLVNRLNWLSTERVFLPIAVTKEKLDGFDLYTLEYVHATMTVTHARRGDVEVKLHCPSGTVSTLAATRKLDECVINSNTGRERLIRTRLIRSST